MQDNKIPPHTPIGAAITHPEEFEQIPVEAYEEQAALCPTIESDIQRNLWEASEQRNKNLMQQNENLRRSNDSIHAEIMTVEKRSDAILDNYNALSDGMLSLLQQHAGNAVSEKEINMMAEEEGMTAHAKAKVALDSALSLITLIKTANISPPNASLDYAVKEAQLEFYELVADYNDFMGEAQCTATVT